LQSYYDELSVKRNATTAEIKRAFRRLMKRHHPDKNPESPRAAERKTKRLIEAHGVLTDPEKRTIHDRALHVFEAQLRTPRLKRLEERTDPVSRCRLILHHLLHGRPSEGVQIYERLLQRDPSFDLLPYLEPRDYLDCKFLLAEQYEQRGNFRRAFLYYREVYEEEKELPRLRYFFEEVKDRLRRLCCRKLTKCTPADEAMQYFHFALELDLPPRDQAFIHKKMAEHYAQQEQFDKAEAELEKAQRLNPKMRGVDRLVTRLQNAK